MPTYMTKQRRVLLEFLQSHNDEVFSALQITKALEDQKISKSAVYRNLTELEKDNMIRRHIKSGTNEVYYQYINPEYCKGIIHLCCTKCSSTFHMDLTDIEDMVSSVLSNNQFEIDKDATVIYGICKNCRI